MGEDAELLAAWSAGDETAGRTFYRRYAERVTRFFSSKTDRDVADLVQRTFTRCVEAQRKGTHIENPAGYLFTIARNELYDEFSRRPRYAFDPVATSLEDLATRPSAKVARIEETELLRVALRRLSLDDQLALELYYWEDLSMAEVAQVLGTTKSAAINRVHRARAKVREHLLSLLESPAAADATLRSLGPAV